MPLKDIKLCHMDRHPTHSNPHEFHVTAWSDDGSKSATFVCQSEYDAHRLREAIRYHSNRLRDVRQLPVPTEPPAA